MKRLLRDIGKGGLAGLAPLILVFWLFGGLTAVLPIAAPFILVAVGALIASYVVDEQTDDKK